MKTPEIKNIDGINLFAPPFIKLKKKVYQARQAVDATIYASEKFITGLEKVAEKILPYDIERYNNLVEVLKSKLNQNERK